MRFSTAPNNVTNTFAIDPNFELGYAQVWQVSVQQNLVSGLVLTGTYIGTKGHAQPATLPAQFRPAGIRRTRRWDPPVTCTRYPTETPRYEAGQIQLMRRFRSGFSGNLMYTYSHAIDDAAGVGGRGQGGTAIAQNWLDLDAERSNSSFDQRHRLTASMQFSTGQGTRGGALLKGWRGALVKDWTFTTNLTVASGLPETPMVLNNRSVAGGTGVDWNAARESHRSGRRNRAPPDWPSIRRLSRRRPPATGATPGATFSAALHSSA